jgi:murein DD-endopeptidase MepM/ murein hydrolase activator NlpD
MDLRQGLRIVLVPQGGGAPRTLTLSPLRVRLLLWAAAAISATGLLFVGTWGFVATKAARTIPLENEIVSLQTELDQVGVLVGRLEAVEEQYARIQELFGSEIQAPDDLWLPFGDGTGQEPPTEVEQNPAPVLWPLTERGFITQTLLEGAEEHPGIDIAVPEGSYIRASGPGRVAETGTDPVFGRFLRIEHADEIETLYAHASMILVRAGDVVRAGEVVGTTGSTGRSTAPHLHFEIRVDGVSVDPLTIVDRP